MSKCLDIAVYSTQAANASFRLVPLTSDNGEEPCPKALLPIGNKPMLEYPLSWIELSGIKSGPSIVISPPHLPDSIPDVLLICPAAHRAAISHYIHSDTSSSSFSTLRIDLQTYDQSQDLSTGTCTLLRHFSNRITRDFLLVPCDIITPPSLPLTKLLNKFRTDSMSDGSIATTCWFEIQNLNLGKDAIPEEWGTSTTKTPIVWDASSGTLLHIDTPDDEDRNGEELELRMALLSKSGVLRTAVNLNLIIWSQIPPNEAFYELSRLACVCLQAECSSCFA